VAIILAERENASIGDVIPTLALMGMAAIRLMPGFNKLVTNFNALRWGKVSLDVVARDLEEVPEEKMHSDPACILFSGYNIRFENVSFRYEGAERVSLEEISLEIPEGGSVAFIGPSGAGKTTAIDLLLGLLQPTQGRILVGGRDIADPEVRTSWQRRIGYIPQTIFLTDDSIRRNVAFGMPDSEIDDAAVWRALEAAHLSDFVSDARQGLDLVVGERGVRFSGGQRQRVGIARALYHNPPVLVMDEATSALDTETERSITAALDTLRESHTMITIAHRATTIERYDQFISLECGHLAGVHDNLPLDASRRR